jgi:hypothetical protein
LNAIHKKEGKGFYKRMAKYSKHKKVIYVTHNAAFVSYSVRHNKRNTKDICGRKAKEP